MIQIQVYLMVQKFINKKLFFKQDKVEKSMVKIVDFAMFRNVFFFSILMIQQRGICRSPQKLPESFHHVCLWHTQLL